MGIKGIEEKEQEEATIHEQINLALGVLKVMGETWKIASNVGNRVRNIARGVLERKVEKQDRSTRDVEDVQESWNLERLVGYESSWDDELAGGEDVETMALSPLQ